MLFNTIESFQRKLNGAIDKIMIAKDKQDKANVKVFDAELELAHKADEVRGHADALIVRANQINKMVDKVIG